MSILLADKPFSFKAVNVASPSAPPLLDPVVKIDLAESGVKRVKLFKYCRLHVLLLLFADVVLALLVASKLRACFTNSWMQMSCRGTSM